jgi:hypothetical protein
VRALRDVAGRWLDVGRERLRERSRSAVAWMVRLTAAAVASFVVASLVFPDSAPLLAPLTALLVVQLTPVSILTSGIQRVASVVAGVSVAVAFSALVGLSWWSLGTIVAVSLLIGQLLRLGPNLIEVPISAMLVLRVGSTTAESAAWQRIAETLVGAGVGVLSNLLFPPRVTSRDAAVAIEDLAEDLAALLDTAADGVVIEESHSGELADRASGWLGRARRLTHDIPNVGAALLQAEESRRLNLRALGTADTGPPLRHGLEALEHSAVAVRSMFRSILDAVRGYDAQGRVLDTDMRAAVALLLHDCATGLRAFGRLVQAESPLAVDPPDPSELRDALDQLRDARARVTDLVLIDPRDDTTLAVLNFALLATVERLLQELDPAEHARHQARRAQTLPARLAAHPREQADLTKQAWRGWRSGGHRR